MTNEDPQKPDGTEGEQPEKKELPDERQNSVFRMLQELIGKNRERKEDILPAIPHTPETLGSIHLTEITSEEIPFKQDDGIGLRKIQLETGEEDAEFTDKGLLDNPVRIGKSTSVDLGAYKTSIVMSCFRDDEGRVYIRTLKSLYRLEPTIIEIPEAIPTLPKIELSPDLQSDKPMKSISDIVQANADRIAAVALDTDATPASPSLEETVRQYGFKDLESAKRALRIAETDADSFAAKGEAVPNGEKEFTRWVLAQAQKGEPGLTSGVIDYTQSRPTREIVYRGPDGMPVARAFLMATVDDVLLYVQNTLKITGWEVKDFATDKEKGLLSSRAAYAVGEELVKLDALRESSTISPDALRLLHGYCTRKIAKLPDHVRSLLRKKD